MTPTQLAHDHLARLNAGDTAGAAALMAEDCINHAAIPEAQGRAGFERVMEKLRAAFPDIRWTIEDTLADADKVVLRTTVTGTQTGALTMTRMPIAATGKAVRFEQIHVVRVRDGKIVEHWSTMDSVAMFRQLGLKVVPAA